MRLTGNSYSIGQVLGMGISVSMLLGATSLTPEPVQAQATSGMVSQGYALLQRGWVNDAIVAFRTALQQSPQSVEARLGLAIAYQRAGEDTEAWTAYQQVLEQAPDNQTALAAVGMLGSYRLEWHQDGIAALTRLLELKPQDLDARSQRALLYGYQGQFAEALADYEIVLAAAPTPDVILDAAQIYTYSGDYERGASLFEQYLAAGGTLPTSTLPAYGLALQETGHLSTAIQVLSSRLQAATSLDTATIQLRTALAIAYQRNNQLDAALTTLAPLRNQPSATLPLARALSAIGREEGDAALYAEAVELYQQVLGQTARPSIGLRTEIADVFSEETMTQPQALLLYDELLAQQPSPDLQIKRLVVSNAIGQISRAELYDQLRPVLTPLPTKAAAQRSIAQALVRVDPPAPELLDTYEALVTSDPFLYFRMAQIHMGQGDLAAAKVSLSAYLTTPRGAQDYAPELLLAEIDRREGELEASVQRYQNILAANPTRRIRTDALRGLAGIYLAQSQIDPALRIYEQLLAANPEDLTSQLGQASIHYQTQQISADEAETVLDRWLRTEPLPEPPPELFYLVGALPPDPARQPLYESLLLVDPNNMAVNRRLIQALVTVDPEQARGRVNDFVVQHPHSLTAYLVQGELAQVIGDLDLAAQAYTTLLEQEPDNVDALSALGGVRFQQRRYAEATDLYNQVLATRPDDLDTRRVLADLSAAQDQPQVALEQLRQLQQRQIETGVADPRVDRRVQQLQVDILRRRGFQPAWERY
jgi:tetratricopeptide (TPR) repeat protein